MWLIESLTNYQCCKIVSSLAIDSYISWSLPPLYDVLPIWNFINFWRAILFISTHSNSTIFRVLLDWKLNMELLHFLYGFLLNPMIDLDSLHGKIGSQHNGAKLTILECRQQSVGHSQVKAAPNKESPRVKHSPHSWLCNFKIQSRIDS